MFYHFLDLVMSNAWSLYKRVHKTKNTNALLLAFADFGKMLCKMGIKANGQRRSIESDIQATKFKGLAQFVPPANICQDEVGHWPVWVKNRICCKLPKCYGKSQTIFFCIIQNISLNCLTHH